MAIAFCTKILQKTRCFDPQFCNLILLCFSLFLIILKSQRRRGGRESVWTTGRLHPTAGGAARRHRGGEQIMKTGLILEGGAMRGMFTAGVTDVLMEHNVTFDGAVGVSAGAVFGCNYKSHQPGRAIRYNLAYCNDKRYASLHNLLHTGDLYSEQFCYHDIPEKLDPFDEETSRLPPWNSLWFAPSCAPATRCTTNAAPATART